MDGEPIPQFLRLTAEERRAAWVARPPVAPPAYRPPEVRERPRWLMSHEEALREYLDGRAFEAWKAAGRPGEGRKARMTRRTRRK